MAATYFCFQHRFQSQCMEMFASSLSPAHTWSQNHAQRRPHTYAIWLQACKSTRPPTPCRASALQLIHFSPESPQVACVHVRNCVQHTQYSAHKWVHNHRPLFMCPQNYRRLLGRQGNPQVGGSKSFFHPGSHNRVYVWNDTANHGST